MPPTPRYAADFHRRRRSEDHPLRRRSEDHPFRNVRIQFWTCPLVGHSEGDWAPSHPVQTVEWRKNIAYCLAPGCGRTSTDDEAARGDLRVVTDDGRRWWLLGSLLWTGQHLYAARTEREAIAAHRRDITAAERANGRSVRDIRDWLRGARISVVAGPLTTVQAYEYDLAVAYATALDQRQNETTLVPVDGNYPLLGIDLAERLDPARAARIRTDVRQQYLAGAEG